MMKTQTQSQDGIKRRMQVKEILSRHERSRILEIYFCRESGRTPTNISSEQKDLLTVSQSEMKTYLLGQYPIDPLQEKFIQLTS